MLPSRYIEFPKISLKRNKLFRKDEFQKDFSREYLFRDLFVDGRTMQNKKAHCILLDKALIYPTGSVNRKNRKKQNSLSKLWANSQGLTRIISLETFKNSVRVSQTR